MATRRERVLLDLEDNLTPGLARAAVASRALKGELNSLGRDTTRASTGIDRTGKSSNKAGPEIDRLSGRLRLLRDAAVLLGPALVPLGAATIPVLTGALAGLGAAAGGIGVSVLALKGVGDAVKALDDYRLEPTAENLQAVRIEMEKLGPAGAHFVHYLESIEGELKSLQLAARAGFLPGLEDGIDAALERLPGVRKIVRELAQGMGELATSAGEDFKPGGDWDAFFHYLDTDGKDTLVSFGNATGDLVNGLADLMVAFAPVNRDFTGGFEEMAQSFADWAAGLDQSQDFQEFLDYIRQNGPRAIDMLGSLTSALAGIVEASAPIGAVTLRVLTRLLDLIGAVAKSPLGTPFIVAVTAVTAYSRAVDIAAAAQTRFNAAKAAGFAGPAAAVTVAALAVAVYEYAEMTKEAESRTRLWSESLTQGTLTVEQLRSDLQAMKDEATADSPGDFLDKAFDPGYWAKHTLLGTILWRRETEQATDTARLFASQLAIVGAQTKNTGDLADLLGASIGRTGNQLRIAAGDAAALEGALARLNGWFDKRQAIRDYNASLRELSRSMRNGFTRQDVINLDDIGRNIAQVAQQISNPQKRASFLDHARDQLEDLAAKSGPRAQAEITKVVKKLEDLGLVSAEPTIDPDTKPADAKIAKTRKSFDIMNALVARPKIEADDTAAALVIRRTRLLLDRIPDEHVKIYVDRVGGMGGPGRGGASTSGGGGGGTAGTGTGSGGGGRQTTERTVDRSVVPSSLTFGKGSNDSQMVMYDRSSSHDWAGSEWAHVGAEANLAAMGLKALKRELAAAEKAVARETRQRDALVARRGAVSSAISGDLSNDLFAVSDASGDPWAAGSTPGGTMDPLAAAQERRDRAQRYITAIRALKRMGLGKGALEAIISEGLEATEFMVAQGQVYASEFASTLAEANQYVAQASNTGANAIVSVAEMNVANAELKEANKRLHAIEKAVEKANKDNKAGHKHTADTTEQATGWAHRSGARRAR